MKSHHCDSPLVKLYAEANLFQFETVEGATLSTGPAFCYLAGMRSLIIVCWLFLGSLAFGQSPLSADELKKLQSEIQREMSQAEPLQYRQRWSIQRNDDGQLIRTPYLMVIFPGLFDSPAHVVDLHNFVVRSFRQNTITVRLRGHYDKSVDMKNSVHGDWLTGFKEQHNSWTGLGEKIVFIGHSTGGLLALDFAQEYRTRTAATVLLGAAVELTWSTKLETYFGSLVGYDKWEAETGRRKVARLGFEVQKLSSRVQKRFQQGLTLSQTPLLIIDSEIDDTVVPAATRDLLSKYPSAAERDYLLFPKAAKLSHRDLRRDQSQVLPRIRKFLQDHL